MNILSKITSIRDPVYLCFSLLIYWHHQLQFLGWLTSKLTKSMVQSHSWEADRSSTTWEIACILWNMKIHYGVHCVPSAVFWNLLTLFKIFLSEKWWWLWSGKNVGCKVCFNLLAQLFLVAIKKTVRNLSQRAYYSAVQHLNQGSSEHYLIAAAGYLFFCTLYT